MTDDRPVLLVTNNDPRFAMAEEIRRRVFIEEQKFPREEEWDAFDNLATHLVILRNGKPAGTLRFYPDGDWLHVGRVAVLSEHRGLGLGRALMQRCVDEGRRLGFTRSFLNAQADKTGFYESLGYRAVGDAFIESGVMHRRMELHGFGGNGAPVPQS